MKKPIVLLIFVCLVLHESKPSVGQTVITGWQVESIHGPSQQGIVDSVPIDINHDGRMDVASVSIDDGHVRAYINTGNQEYDELLIATDVQGAYRLSVIDINQDGAADFLIPVLGSNEIVLLISELQGYRKQIVAENILTPTDAQAADFDGDGLLDVVSVSFEENLLYLHRQLPSNEYETSLISTSPINPRKLVVADYNQDDQADILLASSGDNSIRLFVNQGAAGFVEQVVSDQTNGIRFITACEINDDGMLDFVAAATDDNAIVNFVNTGNGEFFESLLDPFATGVSSLVCADLDGDDAHELVTLSVSLGVIYTYELSGDISKHTVANSRDGYVSLAADKFSDTEDVSILTQSFFEQRNLLYAPDFTNNETVVWEDFPEGASDVEYGDVNGDGTTDLVASSFKNDKVHWYNGLDGTHQVIADQIDGAAEVVVVDLDDDGLVDVLSAASFANKFYWHRNLGNQQFDTILIFDGALFANGLTVVDVNGDGRLDVVGTSGTDDSVRWFDRNGVVFTAHLIDDQNDAPNEVKPYDMDSDGDIDLVVPNYFSNDVFIYYNDGLGNFSAVRIASDLVRVDSTALVDINSDGLIDILASVSGEDHLVQLINQTGGVYKQELLIDGLENPGTIQLDDAVSPVFLQVKDYTNSIESVTVYAVGLLDESISDMVFEFANAFFNTNHVFMTTFIDEIFHHGFEN